MVVSNTTKSAISCEVLRTLPSEFSIILGVFPSMTATAEFVVPVDYQHIVVRSER